MVEVPPPAHNTVTLGSGSINGQSVSGSNRRVTVEAGATLTGSFTVRVRNTMSSGAVAPVVGTPTWGTPSSSWWTVGTVTGKADTTLTVNLPSGLKAPTTAGSYYLAVAMAGYCNGEELASLARPCGGASWGNPDLATQASGVFETGAAQGWANTTGDPPEIGLTSVIVEVVGGIKLDVDIIGGGLVWMDPAGPEYPVGTRVRLEAIADPGYAFAGWGGDLNGSSSVVELTLTRSVAVSVTFKATAGTVYFANRAGAYGIDAPVLDMDGSTRLSGPGYLAHLYAGISPTSLAPVGRPLPFRTNLAAGYFLAEERSIASVSPGARAYVQVRAWAVADGASYEEAIARGGRAGASEVLSVATGNFGSPPSLPAPLAGLRSFKLSRGQPPRIIAGPVRAVVGDGRQAVFEVSAEGSGPLTYRWLHNGMEILGATGMRLIIDPASIADAGTYAVRVSSPFGSVVSTPVELLVAQAARLIFAPTGLLPGEFAFEFEGTPGVLYSIEQSEDLSRWVLVKVVMAQKGAMRFVESSVDRVPARFYRVVFSGQ